MQKSQRLKIFVFTVSTFVIVATMFVNNSGGVNLFDTLKNTLQCPSSSLFLYVCILYTLLIAIPYVPGLELGLLLMIYFGKPGIGAAYICTFIGLNIAFAVGKLASKYWADRRNTHYKRDSQPSPWQSIILQNRYFTPRAKDFMERHIRQHKYLSIGILLNLPGNWIVGGGGGIGLLSGCHPSNSWPKFALTVALATSILPILVYIGLISIETLLQTLETVIKN